MPVQNNCFRDYFFADVQCDFSDFGFLWGWSMIENFVLFVLVMTNIVLIMALSMLAEDDRKRGDFWAERYDDLSSQYSQLLDVVLKSDTSHQTQSLKVRS